MDYIVFMTGLFVPVVALFKRELLIESASFRVILIISVILFIVGIALHFTYVGRNSSSGALLTSLMSLGIYRVLRKIFIKRYRHEPRDTWFIWTSGLAADRLFNIVFFVGSSWLATLNALVMWELSQRGW
ncbi:MAG TPA: hypothetical protein VGP81_10040 [Pyrinomonadaceae bacterium]|jgi:hypothetical protein|nr:hypothetical protein [Pyrinomonadaceae bacterium]